MFSNRLPPQCETNRLTRALSALGAADIPIIDLTESNPTNIGIAYPGDLFDELSADHVRRYNPQPLGLRAAREAVAADYARRGARVDPTQVVLSASSSEAYSWLFKLLCNPGDGVLVPQPSYPLFEHLTRLESAHAIPYQLRYHGRWDIDFDSVMEAPANVRALLLVSPNNPTGSYVTRDEAGRLAEICRSRGWAIVADEVFADYPLDVGSAPTESVMDVDVLSFTLGGASKSLGLPQIKLGWIVVGGRGPERNRALAALEIIADTFLSVGTSVQGAAPQLLARGEGVRHQIRQRIASNLACARDLARQCPSCTLLPVEGGWSLVVRVPAFRSEEALAIELLERERVLVHPGYFFDFPHEAFMVVSLIPPGDRFADAFARALRFASSETSSVHEHRR
jgi:alanine-synthesizing transaminase